MKRIWIAPMMVVYMAGCGSGSENRNKRGPGVEKAQVPAEPDTSGTVAVLDTGTPSGNNQLSNATTDTDLASTDTSSIPVAVQAEVQGGKGNPIVPPTTGCVGPIQSTCPVPVAPIGNGKSPIQVPIGKPGGVTTPVYNPVGTDPNYYGPGNDYSRPVGGYPRFDDMERAEIRDGLRSTPNNLRSTPNSGYVARHHSNPSNFATRVYRGEFSDQFNSYAVFCSKWNGNQYDVDDIVDRGIQAGIVNANRADRSYRSSVEDMLDLDCR